MRDELRDNAFTVVGIDPDVSGSRPLGDLTQRDLRPDPDQLIGHKHLHLISRAQIASSASLTARRSQSALWLVTSTRETTAGAAVAAATAAARRSARSSSSNVGSMIKE